MGHEESTVFHLTHHKAGSQWVYQVLAAAVPGRIVVPRPETAHVMVRPILAGMVYPTVYLTRGELDSVAVPGHQRRVVVIRDLRDTLVSLYFSARYSHPGLTDPRSLERVALLRAGSKEEGLRILMRAWLPRVTQVQRSWVGSEVPVVRFEELVADPARAFGELLRQCDVRVSPRRLAGILAAYSFQSMSGGRAPGAEDVFSHYRKGAIGDWRNHLSGEVLAEFKDLYDDVLIETGYERDADWGAAASRRRPGLVDRVAARGPVVRPCWCGCEELEPYSRHYRRCPACRTLVSTADVRPSELARLYGHEFWTTARFHRSGSWPVRAWRGFPLELVSDLGHEAVLARAEAVTEFVGPGESVLDVAAGSGALIALLRDAGREAVGLEAGEWVAGRAREDAGVPVARKLVGEMTGSFQAVVAVDVLQREVDPLRFLGQCQARLAPGGVLVLDQPMMGVDVDYRQLRALGSDDLTLLRPVEHLYLWTNAALERLLAAAGLGCTLHHQKTLRVVAREPVVPRPQGSSMPGDGLLMAALSAHRDELALAAARLDDERLTGLAELRASRLTTSAQILVADSLSLGAGWHELEWQADVPFRWAPEEAEIIVDQPSEGNDRLLLDLERGPSAGEGALELALLDEDGAVLDQVAVSGGRTRIQLRCPVKPGPRRVLRLHVTGAGRPAPGDSRILYYRLYVLAWQTREENGDSCPCASR